MLSGLALRSKAHWGYSQKFMQSCRDELRYSESQLLDSKYQFLLAERESSVAGFYALEQIAERHYELEALFIEPEHIGKGFGRQLIEHAIETVAARSGEVLRIQGDPHAERFYLAAGAKPVGTRESGSIPGRFLPLFEIRIRPGD